MAWKKLTKLTTSNKKTQNLNEDYRDDSREFLTTNQGVRINDNQNTLKGGVRGPSLLEDFIFREKITHFDHERIPERVVHARGSAAHGYFQLYESLSRYSKAHFLQNVGEKTPVFVRFSTVAGSRGSADTVRDVRGFAVKFYTQEGNFDLVGNNIPVFFIQDALKFPDLIHAAKPEPDNEIPQAQTAHDTFWDFISVMPEATHMIMWIMSDRAIPRSLRMMEGFGVHTFRLINVKGESTFVKFHWKPVLGLHSLAWDEAQKIAGKDPDFHRKDLWHAIEIGQYPEWELGLQLFSESEANNFNFDVLDATKIIPEEIVPVKRVGKLVLNRNPENFFTETEQVAFHPGHIVPGIDFSNDPLLQGRLFSYLDTQLSRLGGPNFHEIPINRPICPFHNNQRDGIHRHTINVGKVAYEPNTLANGYPREALPKENGFVSYPEKMRDTKIRVRSKTFDSHFMQAKLFWDSQSHHEKEHIINALSFELGNVKTIKVRENMVDLLTNVDFTLASSVALNLGLNAPKKQKSKGQSKRKISAALSMANTIKNTIASRQIAIVVAEGFNNSSVQAVKKALEKESAEVSVLGLAFGKVKGINGSIDVDSTIKNKPAVFFDAIYIPDGKSHIKMLKQSKLVNEFINDTYNHYKTIAVNGEAAGLLDENQPIDQAIIMNETANSEFIKAFIKAIAQHRYWGREQPK